MQAMNPQRGAPHLLVPKVTSFHAPTSAMIGNHDTPVAYPKLVYNFRTTGTLKPVRRPAKYSGALDAIRTTTLRERQLERHLLDKSRINGHRGRPELPA